MDAPLITLDDAANTTDVYAFRSDDGSTRYLTTAVAVYPFEEPGIGPNKFNFDDNVLYEIHISLGADVASGESTLVYQFRFTTAFKSEETILQSFLGVVADVDDAAQNLTQTYTVTRVDNRTSTETDLGLCIVPPNNQGIATPFYNQGDNGENPAKPGVGETSALDVYTQQSICNLQDGHQVFAGQRDDGFYGDIQAVFDLLALRQPGVDAQAGYNVHTIALNIPLELLDGPDQVVGVHARTLRQTTRVIEETGDDLSGDFVQVGRQGNPLFAEALVALEDKDRYNRTSPDSDAALFGQYALNPELAGLLNALVFGGNGPAIETDRTDLAAIFIPDLIKVDLSTAAARLAGPPDDEGFSRLSVFGGDALTSTVQPGLPGFPAGTIAGGWPNGRRFGDDVVDIAVTAVISDLRSDPLVINGPAGDNVDANDISYNRVFPYAATPLNGRDHLHHGPTTAQANMLKFAQVGNGAGLRTDIVLFASGVSTTEVSGVVVFKDDDGVETPIDIVPTPGVTVDGAKINFTISPQGSLTIPTSGNGPLLVGSAKVTADGPLSGLARFTIDGLGTTGVQVSPGVSGFRLPVRQEGSVRSGVAIANCSDTELEVTLRLFDESGMEVASTSVILAGMGHVARFVDELFPAEASGMFRGSMTAQTQGGLISGTALELGSSPGELSALPVTPLN